MSARTPACAIVVAVAVAACGGSSKLSARTGTTDSGLLTMSQCMRSHGVKNFPDPQMGPYGSAGMSVSEGVGGTAVTIEGITFSGPAFQAAENACKLFGGRGSRPAVTEAQKQKLIAFAQCMRRNGAPNYPDPRFPGRWWDRAGVPAGRGEPRRPEVPEGRPDLQLRLSRTCSLLIIR